MHWLDPSNPPSIDHAARVAEAESQLAGNPTNAGLRRALGDAFHGARAFAQANASYSAAIEADREVFDRWPQLVEARLWAGMPLEALAACEQGLRAGESGELRLLRGFALRQLGLADQAIPDFERALALGPNTHAPLKALLRPLAERGDPVALLAHCDRLDPRHRQNALVIGYRAAALSQLGRTEEACTLIDLDRYVAWHPIAVPSGYDDIAAFNSALSEAILTDPPPVTPDERVAINYAARTGAPLMALRARVREAMEAYLARFDEMALDRALPPPPPAATMRIGTTVITRDGSNRQHLHPTGYLSSVYYARVPESVRAANDSRGSLQLGPCDQRTRGHRACWGERLIKPIEGWLVIFPSHVFHDVVPTHTNEPRISVPMDLEPVWDAASGPGR